MITIGLQQVTGVPTGTGAIVPIATPWSKLALICSFQLYGIGIGICRVYG